MMGGGTTTLAGHVIIIVAGVGTAFNLFTWILSSRLVSLTLIECVSMIGSLVVPLILAPYLYDGDTVSPIHWVGCVLIFVSMFFFMNKEEKKKEKGGLWKKIALVTICAVSITIATVFKKYYTYHISAKGLGSIEYFTLINFVTVLAVFLVLFAIYYAPEKKRAALEGRSGVELPYKRVWIYILIAAVSLYVNELFTSYAAQLPSAIYYPLARGLTVGCSLLLDVIVFKDKLTVRKIVGLVIVILAIVLVNL
jgi:drug/metabolite transporter (DMT)-like permease